MLVITGKNQKHIIKNIYNDSNPIQPFFLDISHARLKHSRSRGKPWFYFEVVVLSAFLVGQPFLSYFPTTCTLKVGVPRVVAANFLRGKLSLRRCFSINLDLIRHYFFRQPSSGCQSLQITDSPIFFLRLAKMNVFYLNIMRHVKLFFQPKLLFPN